MIRASFGCRSVSTATHPTSSSYDTVLLSVLFTLAHTWREDAAGTMMLATRAKRTTSCGVPPLYFLVVPSPKEANPSRLGSIKNSFHFVGTNVFIRFPPVSLQTAITLMYSSTTTRSSLVKVRRRTKERVIGLFLFLSAACCHVRLLRLSTELTNISCLCCNYYHQLTVMSILTGPPPVLSPSYPRSKRRRKEME